MSGRSGGAASGGNPADSIILEEEVDPDYEPSQEEVVEYARWLGMDPDADADLLYIAREGVCVCRCSPPLPPPPVVAMRQ
jgi:hypothetical protein